MPINSRKPPRKPAGTAKAGRPSREDELRRLIEGVGVDPDMVDPRRVLAAIAIDADSPAGARVAAAKALLQAGSKLPVTGDADHDAELDELSLRAVAALSGATRRPN